jgi:transcription antitermination factor NusG
MAVAYPNVFSGSPAGDLLCESANALKVLPIEDFALSGEGRQWYALAIRPRHEKLAANLLAHKGYESLLPLYKSRRRRPGRYRDVHLPLFPGYLFCQFNPLARLPVLMTPGVVSVVGTGRAPTPIDESEIDSIRRLVSSPLKAQPWPYMAEGQSVFIKDGPLQGLTGTLITVKNSHRLVLSVALLQRSVAVEIDRNWVMPAAPSCSGSAGGFRNI